MIGRRALLGSLVATASLASAQRFKAGRTPGFQSGFRFMGGKAYAVFDASRKAAQIVLSNNSLYMQGSNDYNNYQCVALSGSRTVPTYFEFTVIYFCGQSDEALAFGVFPAGNSVPSPTGFPTSTTATGFVYSPPAGTPFGCYIKPASSTSTNDGSFIVYNNTGSVIESKTHSLVNYSALVAATRYSQLGLNTGQTPFKIFSSPPNNSTPYG